MTESAPLRLKADPGDYQCVWEVPAQNGATERVPGELNLRSNQRPTGSASGTLPDVWTAGAGVKSADFPQVRPFQTLRGHLANGLEVVLLEGELSVWHPEGAVIRARAGFVGLNAIERDDLVFPRASVQITGMDAVAGIGPLKSFTYPDGLSGAWAVEGEPNSDQTWSDALASIRWAYISSTSGPNPFAFSIAFSPVIELTLNEPAPVREWLEQWIEPVRRVMSLATGQREQITYLSMGWEGPDGKATHEVQVYGSLLEQAPFASSAQTHYAQAPAFNVAHDGQSLLALLRTWQRLTAEHHPLLETYGSSIVIPEQHPRARFLLLIQALEGLHGHTTAQSYARRKAENATIRDSILATAKSCVAFGTDELKYLKNHLSAEPRGGLDTALRKLFQELPTDVTDELSSTALVAAVRAAEARAVTPPDALRIARNGLAHGSTGYETRALDEVANILERVTRAHLLRLLGFEPAAQRRALEPTL